MATLALLPGLDGTGIMFRPLVRELGGRCRAQVFSYPQDPGLGYRELTELVRGQLPREDFFILGESFSGPIAVALAAARPPGLKGVILCASFLRNPSPIFPSSLAFLLVAPLFAVWPVSAKMRLLAARQPAEELRDLMREVKKATKPSVLAARTREALRADVLEAFKTLPYPVLYLSGARDIVVPRRNLDLVRTVRPESRVTCLETSHLVLQEDPRGSAASILAFMEDTARRNPAGGGDSARTIPLPVPSREGSAAANHPPQPRQCRNPIG